MTRTTHSAIQPFQLKLHGRWPDFSPSTKALQKPTLDIEVKGVISMSLTRDKIVGHDRERLAFTFLMLNGNEPIECRISEAAMDALAGQRGSQTTARQAQFLAHRDAIEQIASDLFDASPNVKGYVIRIFTKHVPEKRAVPDSIVTASQATADSVF